MLCIRVGRFQRPGQKHSVAKFSRLLQATAGICFFPLVKQFPQARVQGGHLPGGVWGKAPPFSWLLKACFSAMRPNRYRKNIISYFSKSCKRSKKYRGRDFPRSRSFLILGSLAQERLLVQGNQGGFLAGEFFLEHLEDGFGLHHTGAPDHFA